MKWGGAILALMLMGCQKFPDADVVAAKEMAEATQPKEPPCGGRFLTEPELIRMVVGSIETDEDRHRRIYQNDGLIDDYKNDPILGKFKYIISGAAVCMFNISSKIPPQCFFYAQVYNRIYYINEKIYGHPPPRGANIYSC